MVRLVLRRRLQRWLGWAYRWRHAPPPPAAAAATPEQRGEQARARWRRAGRSIMASRALASEAAILGNPLAPPADRLHALVQLAAGVAEAAPAGRRRLAAALLARQVARLQSLWEQLQDELYLTGEAVVGFFSPAAEGQHRAYFTLAALAVLAAIFAAMAGQYAAYSLVAGGASSLDCVARQVAAGRSPYGPAAAARWVAAGKAEWCFGGRAWAFDGDFLIKWGARWASSMRKEPQRWLTSALLHQTFMHLLSNALLLLVLGVQLETKYGGWRVGAVFVAAAAGGNLFSAAWESPCIAVVGASGGIFGLAGAYLADMALNWETLRRPVMRSAGVVGFAAFVAVTVGTTPAGTSHLSHVGGFLVGLCCALVLLPNRHRAWAWEGWLPAAGAAALLALLVSLPLYFYLSVLPSAHC